jgi:hypothetical protein
MLAIWLFCALFPSDALLVLELRVFTEVRERVIMELRSRLFRHINSLCLRFHGQLEWRVAWLCIRSSDALELLPHSDDLYRSQTAPCYCKGIVT